MVGKDIAPHLAALAHHYSPEANSMYCFNGEVVK